MRLFGWVQNKFGGKLDNKRSNKPDYTKLEGREAFSDWPQGLLSIGTFGNDINVKQNNTAESQKNNINYDVDTNEEITREHDIDEEIQDMIITPEEVGNLITKILTRNNNKEIADVDLPLDRFLNCPSSLEVARRISNSFRDNRDLDKTIRDILGGECKELDVIAKRKSMIGKKSISFLMKKMFVCRAGFGPRPSLRDNLQDSTLEKLLRAMLHRKLSTQNSYQTSSTRKYLEDDKAKPNKKGDQDNHDHRSNGSKWDKTDPEYIVLEI